MSRDSQDTASCEQNSFRDQPRTPDTCPHRIEIASHPSFACRVIERLTERPLTDCLVSDDACSMCCEHGLSDGPQINPVLASLAFSKTDGRADRRRSVSEEIRDHQTRAFAERWLAASGSATHPSHTHHSPADEPFQSTRQEAKHADGRPSSDQHSHQTADDDSENREIGITDNLRIGLVGPHRGFGLRYQNLDIARQLKIERWLSPSAYPEPNGLVCRFDSVPRELSDIELEAWMAGLHAVVFVQSPAFPNITRVAKKIGIAVICVPNWEWIHPGMPWVSHVDLMLCPTHFTARMLQNMQSRFRFEWGIESVPWPINTERFTFRRRNQCRRFVYVHGSGGTAVREVDGLPLEYRRKGGDIVLEAARLSPRIRFIVYADRDKIGDVPGNVDVRPLPADNRVLYSDGDVCVQPSRWEGLGLPLLECQAAGMPLITTDAPPMSEHTSFGLIPVNGFQPAILRPNLCIPLPDIDPENLARTLRKTHRRLISLASIRARRFVQRKHSWDQRKAEIMGAIRRTVNAVRQQSDIRV